MVCAGTASRHGPKNIIRSRPLLPVRSRQSFPAPQPASSILAILSLVAELCRTPLRQSVIAASPRVLAWHGLHRDLRAACWREFSGHRGTTSIRASVGDFYTAIDALSIGVLAANAPNRCTFDWRAGCECALRYHLHQSAPPLFATPFITASTGQNYGQPFPYTFAPLDSSRSNPDVDINWATYEPISGTPGI